jgi:hypothetical protein
MERSDQERPPGVSNQTMDSGPTDAEQLLFICIVQDGVVKETVNTLCSWICEVVQSGRMHVNGWWDYLSVVHQRWNRAAVAKVISDTKWWTELLDCWERDESLEYENITFNGEEILANPSMVKFVQSDASGPHRLEEECQGSRS